MKDTLIKWFMSINVQLLKLSHGRLGSRLGTQTVLILRTVGRKSGQERAVPIAYFEYEDSYLIVASNWGKASQAAWYLNLKNDPRASLEINGRLIAVTGREAHGAEYAQLWDFVTKRHPPYLDYQKMTTRSIPLILFERVKG